VPVAVDRDPGLLALSARLLAAADRRIDPRCGDLAAPPPGAHDLVIAAYSLGELPAERLAAAVDAAWERCAGQLVVVEPGTPRGAATISAVRDRLLARGAFLRAPCPHHGPCPLAAPEWCHTALRVPRSRLHRQLKGGTLGGETEHVSYVVASRAAAPRPAARVLTPPVRGPAGIDLRLCRSDGAAGPLRIPRRDPAHAAARRLDQGDGWDPMG
jgi:ribosomal protein RSM22 (predicted rRNA methylase)